MSTIPTTRPTELDWTNAEIRRFTEKAGRLTLTPNGWQYVEDQNVPDDMTAARQALFVLLALNLIIHAEELSDDDFRVDGWSDDEAATVTVVVTHKISEVEVDCPGNNSIPVLDEDRELKLERIVDRNLANARAQQARRAAFHKAVMAHIPANGITLTLGEPFGPDVPVTFTHERSETSLAYLVYELDFLAGSVNGVMAEMEDDFVEELLVMGIVEPMNGRQSCPGGARTEGHPAVDSIEVGDHIPF